MHVHPTKHFGVGGALVRRQSCPSAASFGEVHAQAHSSCEPAGASNESTAVPCRPSTYTLRLPLPVPAPLML